MEMSNFMGQMDYLRIKCPCCTCTCCNMVCVQTTDMQSTLPINVINPLHVGNSINVTCRKEDLKICNFKVTFVF